MSDQVFVSPFEDNQADERIIVVVEVLRLDELGKDEWVGVSAP